MTLEDSTQAFRLRVFAEAERLGNVKAACERYGLSRTQFYELRKGYLKHGAAALRPKPTSRRPGRPGRRGVLLGRALRHVRPF
jgi:hypothetical protein